MRFLIGLLAILSLGAAAPIEERDHDLEERQGGLQIIRNCQVSGQVAWTFDDGPYQWEQKIANEMNGGKATFFLNGNNYRCIYDQVDQIRAVHAAGHTLGSHTWSHRDLTKLSEGDINWELEQVEQAFIRILGLKPLYFRPPYGAYNDLVLKVLRQRGYKKLFLWSDDTGDSTGASASSQQAVMNRVINDYPRPHLVLSHSVIDSTANNIVPNTVWRLQQKGYKLVAVDTCLGSNGEWPYQWVGNPGNRDGSWHC